MEQAPNAKSKIEEKSRLESVKGMSDSFHASPHIKSIIGKYYKTSRPDKIVLEVERKDDTVRVFTLVLPRDILVVPRHVIGELHPGFDANKIEDFSEVIAKNLKKEFSLP